MTVKTGRPRSADIETKVDYCEKQKRQTEHRLWRRGVYKDGTPRLRWICTECQNESNKASHQRRKREAA